MSDGVKWFEPASVTVPVYFPEGKRACKWCWLFCRFERDYNRYSCKLSNEWLDDIDHRIGKACPLQFEEGDKR